jgi:transposase
MSNSKSKPRIEVVSDAKTGRRHWPDDEKLKIVQESLQDGVVQAQLARQHGVSPSQLYDWRYRYKAGLLVGAPEFSQVVVVADDAEDTPDQASSMATRPDLVVEVGQRYRLTIPAGFDMVAASRLLRGLA